jgi:hypothetical protein
VRGPWVAAAGLVLCAGALPAADDVQPHFRLTGSATPSSAAPTTAGGRFAISAELRTAVDATGASAAGRFVMDAIATPTSLVCYSDTIFRNDFDGDGL